MKTIKIIFALAYLALSTLICEAQVSFAYDAAGNRISRSVPPKKSTSQEENVIQPEQMELKDNAGEADILIYPNPAKDEITVMIPGLNENEFAVICVFGQGGSLLYRNDYAITTNIICFTDYSAGIYYMTIDVGDNFIKWKVVKE